LQPGQRVEVDLGGQGTTVTGWVVLSGAGAATIDLHKSLSWLVRRAPGIEPPPELRALGFDARRGWSNAWTSSLEGLAYLQTLDHDSVRLDQEGRFRISGIPAGDYDLAIQLYEQPGEGCLVNPVGSRTVRVQVTEEAARGPSLDLGNIEVKAALGPRPGEVVPDFAFAGFSGETVKLSDLRGRYVLLNFWAIGCGPCVTSLPAVGRLHDAYGAGKGLVILGLNLDPDRVEARRFVESRKLRGTHGSLGGRAGEPILAQLAISSVPAYFLIGPDGKLIHRGARLEEIDEAMRRVLR
jgi:thiol-disulfide isomerase/thioredoxin